MTIRPKLTRSNLAEINVKSYTWVQTLSCTNTSQICLSLVVFYATKNVRDFTDRNFIWAKCMIWRPGKLVWVQVALAGVSHLWHLIENQFSMAIINGVTNKERWKACCTLYGHATWVLCVQHLVACFKRDIDKSKYLKMLPTGKRSRKRILEAFLECFHDWNVPSSLSCNLHS